MSGGAPWGGAGATAAPAVAWEVAQAPAGAVARPGPALPPISGASLTGLTSRINAVLDAPEFRGAQWFVRVETLDGDVLYDRDGEEVAMPASLMKLFTTAAAFAKLGPEFRYETRLEVRGDVDANGVLQGSLVIVGSGDPSLGAWHPENVVQSPELLRTWVAAVRASGIREISGDVVGDGRFFSRQYYNPEWELGDLPFWYATGTSGLAIEENAFRFSVAPGPTVGAPAIIRTMPQTEFLTIENRVTTRPSGRRSIAEVSWRDPQSNTIRIDGAVAVDSPPLEGGRGSVWDGPLYAATLLTERLRNAGIVVRGGARSMATMPNARELDNTPEGQRRTISTNTSPALRDLVRVINKDSHNFFADQVVRTLGARFGSFGGYRSGTEVVRDWLEKVGVPSVPLLQMSDGSGLSRRNGMQARQLTALLRHVETSEPWRAAFRATLPVAGVDGTMKKRLTGAAVKGRVLAKTGYIPRVRTIAGYATTADDETLVFCILANSYRVETQRVERAQDAVCEALTQFRRMSNP